MFEGLDEAGITPSHLCCLPLVPEITFEFSAAVNGFAEASPVAL